MPSTVTSRRLRRNQLFLLLIALVAIYVLVPQLKIFKNSPKILLHAHVDFVVLALFYTLLTYVFAAATYFLLAFKRLRYPRTLLLQFASMLTNRLLPAGIGGIGLNYAYLRKQGHTKTEAVGVVASNNCLGFIGHFILLVVVLLLYRNRLPVIHYSVHVTHYLIIAAFVAVVLLLVGVLRYGRQLLTAIIRTLVQIRMLGRRPMSVLYGLTSSMFLTLCNITSLFYCMKALDIRVAFFSVVIVFTFGIALGSATPTPGGLGGMEAGLLAGLIAYKVPSSDALAAVLLYRLISYWLTLIIGGAAFIVADRRAYF